MRLPTSPTAVFPGLRSYTTDCAGALRDLDPLGPDIVGLGQGDGEDAAIQCCPDRLLVDGNGKQGLVGEPAGVARRVPQDALGLFDVLRPLDLQPAPGDVDDDVVLLDTGQVQLDSEPLIALLRLATWSEVAIGEDQRPALRKEVPSDDDFCQSIASLVQSTGS